MRTRQAAAALLGIGCFTLAAAATLDAFCYSGVFVSCSGSAFQPWVLLIHAVGALFILGITLLIQLVLRRTSWYRSWHVVFLCVVMSVVLPKIYMMATGPDATFTLSIIDYVFAVGGFVMGMVLLALWQQRSNSGVQPTPVSGRG